MKKFIVTILAIVALFVSASPAVADSYGGPSETKDILIDKRVGVPYNSQGETRVEYIDNVSTDRHTYRPHDVVFFELRVKNTSTVRLHDVKITDFGPEYFTMFENPGDVLNNILNLDAGDFGPGEEKAFVIRGRIFHNDSVPTGTTCIVNRVRAESEGVADEDTAQFCFHKGTSPVTKGGVPAPVPETIPSTGATDSLAILSLASMLGYAGLRLRKNS